MNPRYRDKHKVCCESWVRTPAGEVTYKKLAAVREVAIEKLEVTRKKLAAWGSEIPVLFVTFYCT